MRYTKTIIPLLACTTLISTAGFSQAESALRQPPKDNYGSGLKINLDEGGSKYVRFIVMNQIWAKYNENNPNTIVNGEQKNQTFDIGIRRARFISYAQISEKFLILTHFGINNQSFSTGGTLGSNGTGGYGMGKKPGLFMHDAYTEYAVVPDFDKSKNKKNDYSLYIGAGLHYYNGVSRLTNNSTLNFATLDAPIYNWALIENSDQFARQIGIFAKGNLKKFSYNFSVNKPFATNIEPEHHAIKGNVAVDNNGDSKLSVQGYADYQFFDKESNLLPFKVGAYLGSKKVLNVGAGFYYNADGTKSKSANGDILKHDILLLGIDVFGDLPIGEKSKGSCINFLGTYYNYNFGPNYNRSIGIMNVAGGLLPNGKSSISGAGNSKLMIGTGQILYTQLGYLVPKWNEYQKAQIMPYIANSYKQLDFVDEAGNYFDIGVNWFLDGHHSKITAQYSSRPLYFTDGTKYLIGDRKGEFIVQFQVFL